ACHLAARNIADIEPVRVHLVRADALSALVEYEGRADVVVSNPPYVPGSAHPTQREAQLDPPRALYGGGEDGLVIPRGIMTRARALLAPGGTLVMEHAESQAEDLVAYATAQGFTNVHTAPDLTGRPRMVIATAPVVEQ
ncbi:MAG: peptide chain release factor N(5)-glutamine methyltransferase, partial [Actinomyces sp.]|nr:peptide chain release factor N(5)-glutamine methyltransferase [Actinomyces sp.]